MYYPGKTHCATTYRMLLMLEGPNELCSAITRLYIGIRPASVWFDLKWVKKPLQ